MADWLERKIARLNEIDDDDDKRQIISDIIIKLRSLTNREIEEIVVTIDLTGLFSQLTSDNRQCVEDICSILDIVLVAMEPGEPHRRYPAEMRKFVTHPEPTVRCAALKALLLEASSPEKSSQLVNDANLLTLTVERIGDDDLGVAKLAVETAKKIGATGNGAKILYSGTCLRTIARLMTKNDVVTFRVYEVVADVAKVSEEHLRASENSGFLSSLINMLDEDDFLLQLNALEVMTELTLNDRGLDYLEERGVLKRLSERIVRASEDPLSNLLIPGLMKFFGCVERSRPNEITSKYPNVVAALFDVVESGDRGLLGNALDTLGFVGSTVDGKYALQAFGDSMPRAMAKIGEIIKTTNTELRVRGLENLALIVRVDKKDRDNRILTLTKCWFDKIGENPMGTIVDLAKQPFADIRLSSLEVIASLSLQNWGQEYIADFPGLVEFLLDRNVEGFKNCKDAKYRIAKNLCEADVDVFDGGTLEKFKKFVVQGPYYVDAEMEVATEGAS